MAIDEKDVKEFEDKNKNELFQAINTLYSNQADQILTVQKLAKQLNIDLRLPNIGVTLRNKLVELQRQFKGAGISMYSNKVENYGPAKLDMISTSFLGEAIVSDLLNYTVKGSQSLNECNNIIRDIATEKMGEIKALTNASPLKKFFNKVMDIFNIERKIILSYDQEEREIVNLAVSRCDEANDELYKYTLRDNIVSTLVSYIRQEGYRAFVVPKLLEECIAPDLQKLGLDDLIPELKRALIEEYKKDLPNESIDQIKQENIYLHVPDFSRKDENDEEIEKKIYYENAVIVEKSNEESSKLKEEETIIKDNEREDEER